MSLFDAGGKRFLDIFKCDSLIEPCVLFLGAMSLPLISLEKRASVCVKLDGFGYDMATAIMAWKDTRSIDCLAMTPETVA